MIFPIHEDYIFLNQETAEQLHSPLFVQEYVLTGFAGDSLCNISKITFITSKHGTQVLDKGRYTPKVTEIVMINA